MATTVSPQSGSPNYRPRSETLPGPIYIHCHHGKHRSPAASTAACVGAGLLRPADALPVLQFAGTSPHYTVCFTMSRPRGRSPLAKNSDKFSETSPVPQLVARMVQLEHWQAALSKVLKSPPNNVTANDREKPAAVALLLREQFTELLRDESNQHRPTHYMQLLQKAKRRHSVWKHISRAKTPICKCRRHAMKQVSY